MKSRSQSRLTSLVVRLAGLTGSSAILVPLASAVLTSGHSGHPHPVTRGHHSTAHHVTRGYHSESPWAERGHHHATSSHAPAATTSRERWGKERGARVVHPMVHCEGAVRMSNHAVRLSIRGSHGGPEVTSITMWPLSTA